MGILISLVIGGVVGWLASIVMKTNAQMGLIANVVVGIVGSALGFWLAGVLGIAAGAHDSVVGDRRCRCGHPDRTAESDQCAGLERGSRRNDGALSSISAQVLDALTNGADSETTVAPGDRLEWMALPARERHPSSGTSGSRRSFR